MRHYLFLFSLGPVQSFISQARKTQDLYAGSQLLSQLITSTIDEAQHQLGERFQLRFPQKELMSKPNRFFAKLDCASDKEVEQFGSALKKHVRQRFREIASTYLKKAHLHDISNQFFSQIDRHLEVYWAAKLLKDNYCDEYPGLEALLGASKNIREFQTLTEIGRKCSVCGERNVLFCCKSESVRNGMTPKTRMQLKPRWNLLNEEETAIVKKYNESIQELDIQMPDNEGLCAVCFTKRRYQSDEQPEFPSTAEIAVCHQISVDDLNGFKNGQEVFRLHKLEPQLLYEENLTPQYLKKYQIEHDLETVKKWRKHVLKNSKLKDDDLCKYYSLLMFDVDRMGAWLSGEYLPEKNRSEEFHQELSRRLAEFGDAVREDLILPRGKAVFSAGDDFLGFVNLSHLFEVVRELQYRFHKSVNAPLVKKFAIKNPLTFSAGISIAHYKTPLPEVLRWTRKMEENAKMDKDKGGGDRNAFGIAAIMHSGSVTTTCFKWNPGIAEEDASPEEQDMAERLTTHILTSIKKPKDFSKEFITNLDLFESIVQFLQQEKFSRKCLVTLDVEMRKLLDDHGYLDLEYVTDAVVKAEITRLVKRAKAPQRVESDEVQLMTDCMYALYKQSQTFTNFLSALHITDVIKREAKPKHDK